MRKTQITIEVDLDANHVPEKITWNAEDGGIQKVNTNAAMISVWDHKKLEALRVDLWTKEMPVDHMKGFFHQVLISMGDSYERATGEKEIGAWFYNMAEQFAKQVGIKE